MIFSGIKEFQVFSLFLLCLYLLNRLNLFKITRLGMALMVFSAFIFFTSLISYIRFDNSYALYFSGSYTLKLIHLLLLFVAISSRSVYVYVLKFSVFLMFLFSLHSQAQLLAVAFDLVSPIGVIVTQGYKFINLGLMGIYRVEFPLFGHTLIRAQSFFQEPGFLASYIIFAIVLLDFIKYQFGFKRVLLFHLVFISAMISTLSLTGILLMTVYYFIKYRLVALRALLLSMSAFILGWIVFNDNEFIGKSGSLALRLEHTSVIDDVFSNISNVFFGIGFGNEELFTDGKINNFIFEVLMYSSIFGLVVIAYVIFLQMKYYKATNYLIPTILLFSLTTPMFWSPILILSMLIVDKFTHWTTTYKVSKKFEISSS